jgi:hypothetical protein
MNKLQCKMIIMGYRSFYDSFINCDASEEIKKAMEEECKRMSAEFSIAFKTLKQIEKEENNEQD